MQGMEGRDNAAKTAAVDTETSAEKRPPKTRPKHRRKKRKIAALGLALALLTGSIVVVGSVFYASVDLPDELDAALDQGSTIYYSDGSTVLGELAAEQRTSVDLDEIADDVEWALVAAEDANFYSHPGIDAKGVLRALVNNVTGGAQQGASTLTQQYVGLAADIRGDGSYLRKAREAAMAMKMEDEFTKDEILNHYLNLVYFGRGAYGVEAAAQEFFGQSAADLSTSQSALLVAQIKSPDGPYDPRDPYGQGNDIEEATERWEYVLDQMVAAGKLDEVKRAALTELPETLDPTDDEEGLGPEGFVTNGFVLNELAASGLGTDQVLRGGFDVVTTLDAELQGIVLEQTGIREVAAEDEGMAAALAAVEPGTGRVLAYYGGENGAGLDQADDVGHRPGTAFNIATGVAAFEDGFPVWDAILDGTSPQRFATYLDVDGEEMDLVNTGGASVEEISLADAIMQKLDTPLYAVAEEIHGEAIARAAAALGIERMWDPHNVDDEGVLAEIATGGTGFQPDLGIGAYPVTVLDMASMYATLAAKGDAAEPYFVERVTGPDGVVFDTEPQVTEEAIDLGVAVESAVPLYMNGFEARGRDEDGQFAVNASSTWHTGFSPALSLAVWAGDDREEGNGAPPEGTVAERIWWALMDARPDSYRQAEEEEKDREGDIFVPNQEAPPGEDAADAEPDDADADEEALLEAQQSEAEAADEAAEEAASDEPTEKESWEFGDEPTDEES